MLYKYEGDFRIALKKFLESHGWQVQIIEVGVINRGVPDLYVCKNGHEHWIELKSSRASFTGQWIIDFRPGQQAWLRRNFVHGGRPIVLESGDRQFAIHKYEKVIKDNTLYQDYEVVNGFERIAYIMENY